MTDYTTLNDIMLMIQNNDHTAFINHIPTLEHDELISQLVSTLCNTTHSSHWLESAMPKFNVNVDPDILQQNIMTLIQQDVSIETLRKISAILIDPSLVNFTMKQTLIDKMLDFFHKFRISMNLNDIDIIPHETIFFRICAILKKFKDAEPDKVRYTLENVCYIYAYRKHLNPQTVLKHMYSLLDYSDYY
ncbi:hypothetical protein crov099 [Cafeteria roenbergensis virus]|uniref:Uncharacterized protein n=1 Tax=Cafeteria roenbergensis virus (strain BV-PW1) TaxID=693272 RepID=E3T4L9_CROVB|nr:hypothetical protein crov099 [Cafeteria roenbergensis virus BV-PW1]ADO67132.1 hypothetical protein crov099 [Cafeteria roenbergensis virus BV-PW1]